MSDPSRMVVDTAGPGDFVDSGDDHFDTDHFIEQLFPVRRENHEPEFEEEVKPEKEESIIENPDRCLNVSCPPVHNCAKYKLEEGECCARCVNLVNKWRTCSQCQPVPGCLKYKIPKRPGAGCCATCVKRKNRVADGPCSTTLCPSHRVCRVKNGEAVCVCKEKCPNSYNPVCGSNGVTYLNPCYRKRAECASGVPIPQRFRRACKHPF